MAKVDLHVHSCYSERPSEWFLQRIGTRESYVEPEEVYRLAKREGMDFVTITDHNTIDGALRLQEKHPADVFTGVEITTYFPEDGTKIHMLVWGLDTPQFRQLDKIRSNIYELRDCLAETKLPHAVAHLTFSPNDMLTFEHVERLFLLFDHFETHNGSRERTSKDILTKVFASLSPGKLQELSEKYFVKPLSRDSWRKGEVGGSDDHSGLFVGKTYTSADASTPEEFLARIGGKQTSPDGRCNDYQGLAFAVYKVAYDFSQTKSHLTGSVLSAVNSLIFDEKPIDLKKQAVLKKLKFAKAMKKDNLMTMLSNMVVALQENRNMSADDKLALVSNTITLAADELVRRLFVKISGDVQQGDLVELLRSITGVLPGVFLSIPFFTSLNVLNQSRWLHNKLLDEYVSPENRKGKRVVWFTDTFLELSGVSATLQELAQLSHDRHLDLAVATCLPPYAERGVSVPPNVIDLPCIHSYTPEFFSTFTLRIPSVLASLKLICEAAPDEIYISTPGPVGLLGVLASKLLHVPSTAVYHTDFTRQFRQIIGDETLCRITEDYVNWFHSLTTTVAVPTLEYTTLLERRGISRTKLRRFRRGIDPTVFAPVGSGEYLARTFGITDGITLLHSGRVSKEKNLDFMADIYQSIIENRPDVNLIFAGNGPYFEEFREKMKQHKRVYFPGRIDRAHLPALYSSSHILVFPSVTETFGMVVLEAQSCGLPALVSDFGGPQEIIINGKTGFIAEANNLDDWKNKVQGLISMIGDYPSLYLEMRVNARRHASETYSWDLVLQDIFGSARSDSWQMRERELYMPYGDIVNLERQGA